MLNRVCLLFFIGLFNLLIIPHCHADIDTGLLGRYDFVRIQSSHDSSGYGTTAASIAQNFELKDNLTISAWVYFYDLQGWQTLLGQDTLSWSGGNAAFYLNKANPFPRCGRFGNQFNIYLAVSANSCDPGDWAGGTTVPVPYTWYMVTGTYDGSNMKLYVNGVLEGTSPRTGNIGMQTGQLNIGSGFYGGNQVDYVDGVVDYARVYNRALSDDDVAELYRHQHNAHAIAQ